MGIGIAFRKKALESAGGFNPDLQVFEYLDLFIRHGFKSIKSPEFTVLHLEPESRFTLIGYLRRRMEYGFWYHSLYYLYPSRLSINAFPVKLAGIVALIALGIGLRSLPILSLVVAVWVGWMIYRFQLAKADNSVRYAASKYNRTYQKVIAVVIAISVLSLGELANDLGKLKGMFRSPTRN